MKDLDSILDKVIEENTNLVNEWLIDKPGSWGALSGKALVAVNKELGKSLGDQDRRLVWQLLWNRLMEIKSETI